MITGVRGDLCELMAVERAHGDPRDIFVLAVDGVTYGVGAAAYRSATAVTELSSVFPTVSAPNWISSITGRTVDAHGVPGVVFRPMAGHPPQHIFDHAAETFADSRENVFSDARAIGYDPVAVTCDLDAYPGAWHDVMVDGARREPGGRIFTDGTLSTAVLMGISGAADRLAGAVEPLLRARRSNAPRLIWLYVELDLYVHAQGYDAEACAFLAELDAVARGLAEAGAIAVAYTDHGLVPTRHDPGIAATLAALAQRFASPLGGAGRCRWFYAADAVRPDLAAALAAELPGDVRVERSETFFAPGTLAAARAGSVLVIANGDTFLNAPGSEFDHGSLRPEEVRVPFARWGDLR